MFSRFLPAWSTASVYAAGFLIASMSVALNTGTRTFLDADVLAQSRGGNVSGALAQLNCFENSWGPFPCATQGANCVTCTQISYTGLGVGGGGWQEVPAPQNCGNLQNGKCITDTVCLGTGFPLTGFCSVPGTVISQ